MCKTMNIQSKKQPNEGSSRMPSNREANIGWVLSKSEIKQEPIMKEEPFDYTDDDVLVMTFPHSDAWLFGNLAKVKTKDCVEKIAGKGETGQMVAMKPISNKKKSNFDSFGGNDVAAKTKIRSESKWPKDRMKSQHKCSLYGHSILYTTTAGEHSRKHIGGGLSSYNHFSNRLLRKAYLHGDMQTNFDRFQFGSWNFGKGFTNWVQTTSMRSVIKECYSTI